jgi:small subunit ribosomal protein S8
VAVSAGTCRNLDFVELILDAWPVKVVCPALRKHPGNMPVTDPIADMLTRLRNASLVHMPQVVMPHSQLKEALAKVLQKEGFVGRVTERSTDNRKELVIGLKYSEADKKPAIRGIDRVSKPGQRIYVAKKKIPRVNQGLGMAVLSTPQGLLTDGQARKRGVGGEVMCVVW